MFNSIGERIVYCRGILGYSRKEFAEQMNGISLSTLSRWELNYVRIPDKQLDKLVVFFNENGIKVSSDWIKNNHGIPPVNLNLEDFQDIEFDEVTYSIMLELRKKVKNFQFKQLSNNFYAPVLSYGDYVCGASNSNHESLDNKLCFIISEFDVSAGVFSFGDRSLKNTKNEKKYYDNLNELLLGEVLWLARRP